MENDTSVGFLCEWKHLSALSLMLHYWNVLRLKATDLEDKEKVAHIFFLYFFFMPVESSLFQNDIPTTALTFPSNHSFD